MFLYVVFQEAFILFSKFFTRIFIGFLLVLLLASVPFFSSFAESENTISSPSPC